MVADPGGVKTGLTFKKKNPAPDPTLKGKILIQIRPSRKKRIRLRNPGLEHCSRSIVFFLVLAWIKDSKIRTVPGRDK